MPERPPSPDTLADIARIRQRIEGVASSPDTMNATSTDFPQIAEAERLLHINRSSVSTSENDQLIDEMKDNLYSVEPSHHESGKHLDQALCLVEQLRNRLTTCPICYNSTTDTLKTPCGHVFCRYCIQRWLKDHRHCPNCRGRLTPADLGLTNAEGQIYTAAAENGPFIEILNIASMRPAASTTTPFPDHAQFLLLNELDDDGLLYRRNQVSHTHNEHPQLHSDSRASWLQLAVPPRPLSPMRLPMPPYTGDEDLNEIMPQALANRMSIEQGNYDESIKRQAAGLWYDISRTGSAMSPGDFINGFRVARIRQLAERLASLASHE